MKEIRVGTASFGQEIPMPQILSNSDNHIGLLVHPSEPEIEIGDKVVSNLPPIGTFEVVSIEAKRLSRGDWSKQSFIPNYVKVKVRRI